MSLEGSLEYRRLRAPLGSGTALVEPELARASGDARQSIAPAFELLGRSGGDLQSIARRDLLTAARAYTAQYRDVPATAGEGPIFLGGHQPELFHPGVWFKNFVLDELARRTGGTAVNLVIDNDLCRRPSIEVPAGEGEAMRRMSIAYDEAGDPLPYEDRPIRDAELFARFPQAVAEACGPWGADSLLPRLWKYVLESRGPGEELGLRLARGRHRLEQDFGLSTLELPLSYLCRTPWFCWFTAALMAEAPRFAEIYNRTLAEYRALHRLRNQAAPAPDLECSGEQCELPFWAWHREAPQRSRLYLRRRGNELLLFTEREELGTMPHAEHDAEGASAALLELQAGGWRIRPRALLTTLYARLLLGDCFVHGIGGAKYDQVTDLVACRWLGAAPPPYLTATATFRLPLGAPPPGEVERQVAEARRTLREMKYHPERFGEARDVGAMSAAAFEELVAEKRRRVAEEPPRGAGKPRREAIVELNAAMRGGLTSAEQHLEAQLLALQESARQAEWKNGREFSFCLFSEELPERLSVLAGEA